MNIEIEAAMAIELTGEAAGVKLGGVLQHSLREVQVKALPKDLPEKYEIDVSELDIGQAIKIADLKPIPGVEFLGTPEETVVNVMAPTLQKEEVEEEVEGEEAQAEEAGQAEEQEEKPAENTE